MKNFIFVSLACISFCMPVCAQTDGIVDSQEEVLEELSLGCSIYDQSSAIEGPHRTPPRIPTVYYNRSANKLLFAEPMGECVIELVDTDTEEIVFALPVMCGITQVQLPLLSTGQYQLRIIRSVYMFSGIIEF